jgi:ArsR family transcriptional regulator
MTRTRAAEVAPAACCAPIATASLTESEAGEMARAFAALGDPVRLRLFSMIASADEICSCDLLEPLGRAQPTVSHHTKALAEAGLITGDKRGRWVYWRANRDRLTELSRSLQP